MNLQITFEGLRNLIRDLRAQGVKPVGILVSPIEKRDLKQQLMAHSIEHSKDAEAADHDLETIGIIEGVMIVSHEDVPRGKARIITGTDPTDRNRDVMVR